MRGVPGSSRQWVWEGRDDDGQSLPSGIYLVHAQTKGAVAQRRVVLMR